MVTGRCSSTPIATATSAHNGVTDSHSTMFLAYHSRRSAAGSGRAARLRAGSAPSRLVAGTSAYIQQARTIANASGPWTRNTTPTTLAGSSA